MKHYLMVCRQNIGRSYQAKLWAENFALENGLEYTVDSAGWEVGKEAGESWVGHVRKQVTRELVGQADAIFVMEDYMKEMLEQHYGARNVYSLGIPDDFARTMRERDDIPLDITPAEADIWLKMKPKDEHFGSVVFHALLEYRLAPYLLKLA